MIWFTADHHFGHGNIIRFCHRPFTNAEAMDAAMVRDWNATVGVHDLVYHLGDLSLERLSFVERVVAQLNGRIKLVPGSHDHWIKDIHSVPLKSRSGIPLEIMPPMYVAKCLWNQEERAITLCHYAMRRWPASHYGTIHLYGHSHGRLPGLGRSMDVGVDAHDFKPVSLKAVVERMDAILAPKLSESGKDGAEETYEAQDMVQNP